jgi:subtilase family serine protease
MGGFMSVNPRAAWILAAIIGAVSAALVNPAAAQTDTTTGGMPSAGSASRSTSPPRNIPSRITQAIDETQLVPLHGNIHPLARQKYDQGPVSDSQPMNRMLLLLQRAPEQEAELRQLLEDQLTLNSPSHHAWLTPEQFGARFGPSDADLAATIAWLNTRGFHGVKLGPGRTVIEFSGTAAQVRDALHTEIHRYVVRGVEHFANAGDPQIPTALAPVVAGVVSLHNFPRFSHLHHAGNFQRANETGEIKPLFSFAGCGNSTGGQCNALGPADLAKIYNVPPTLDGTGQSVAIVAQSNIDLRDIRDYRAMFGLSSNDPTIILNGPDPGLIVDEGEAILDVEVSSAMAPKTTIKFVVSETPTTGVTAGIDLSALYIVDHNIAAVLSESYGLCEANLGATGNAFYNALWQQATAQGITVLVSTGDSGSAGCDDPNSTDFASSGLAVSGIASTPFNVAVGGTDFSYTTASPSSVYWSVTNSGTPPSESAKSYIPESTWNDSCAAAGNTTGCTASTVSLNSGVDLVAASGGPSSRYSKPAWQSGITGMPADSKRDTPDISLFASNGQNNSFYIVCQRDFTGANSCDLNSPFTNFAGVGGTSASVQAFAGIMALINQSQATVQNPAPRQGNANYILYKLYKQHPTNICASTPASVSVSGCIFYDVTAGNISVACRGGSPNCSNTSTATSQFGVLTSGGLPAWKATSGYDLATGLGTVNVANLAAAWGSVGLTATTTTITASPTSTVAHGTNASFTVHVAASSGTPTGQTSLIATPAGAAQSGVGPITLASGTATFFTNMLPGGTAYNVVAHYSGDGTFAQSDSAPVLVTVSKETSVTSVGLVTFSFTTGAITSTNAHAAAYGSPYIMRVDVTNAAGVRCSTNLDNGSIPPLNTIPCPTGNVTMTDNGSAFNDFINSNTSVASNIVPLNAQGYFEDQPIQLSAGNHSFVATYAGDNSYASGASAADVVAISQATTSIQLSGPSTAAMNQQVTLTAAIATNSNGAAPTGTVTFSAGGSPLGTVSVAGVAFDLNTVSSASATAALPITFSSTGSKNITAQYSGDTNYAAAGPSSPIALNITAGAAGAGSFSVTATPVSVLAGSSNASTITITPGSGFTAGVVQVTCAGTALPPGVTCAPSPLSINVPATTPATAQLTVSVLAPSTTVSAASLPAPHSHFGAIMTASVARFPNGNLNATSAAGWWFLSAATALSALLLLIPWIPGVAGPDLRKDWRKQFQAALALTLVCVLTQTLGCGGSTGGGGGGGGAAATHTSISVNTSKLPSTTNNFAFTITVTSAVNPTGQVQLFDAGVPLGLPLTVSNGTALTNIGLGAVGTHSISAHYLGNVATQPSLSGTLNLTVTGTTIIPLTTTPTGTGNISLTIQ